jgi:hypothetical protein
MPLAAMLRRLQTASCISLSCSYLLANSFIFVVPASAPVVTPFPPSKKYSSSFRS